MLRSLALAVLASVALAASGTSARAQANVLDVRGTTAGAPAASLPLFGSTPGMCDVGALAEPYEQTDLRTDTAGRHDLGIAEAVQTLPDTDDTVLLVYAGAFDPADACANLLGVGNETIGSGLALDLAAGDYTLVVAGFLGTEDAYTVRVTGPAGSTVTSARVVSDGGGPEAVALALGTAYPNPSASGTTVPYGLAEAGPVRLAVYDALGREVAVLVDAPQRAGRHEALIAASALPAGSYLVRLVAGGEVRTRSLTVSR
ncbi:MAG: T9SS type A sorting domain-containing protein [Bacteroidota bacterium]